MFVVSLRYECITHMILMSGDHVADADRESSALPTRHIQSGHGKL